jgi:hypothetical protein
MKPIVIGDVETGEKYFYQQEKDYGRDWDRETRNALNKLYCSEYKIYAIRLKPGLEEELTDFIEKSNKEYFCPYNSRALFSQQKDKDILVLNMYSDEEEVQKSLEKLIKERRARYAVAIGNAWSFEDNTYWYLTLV